MPVKRVGAQEDSITEEVRLFSSLLSFANILPTGHNYKVNLLKIIKEINEKCPDSFLRTHGGKSVLHTAVIRKNEVFVNILLSDIRSEYKDRLINLSDDSSNGATALHFAAHQGCVAIAKLLLINSTERQGLLIKTGSAINCTALYIATEYMHVDLVDLLLEYSDDKSALLEMQSVNGSTVLHVVAQNGNDLVAEILLKYAKHNYALLKKQKSTEGDSALHVAAAYNHKKIIELILNASDKDNRKDLIYLERDDGTVPLYFAVQNGRIDIVSLMISYSDGWLSLLKVVTKNDLTLLHIAAEKGHKDIVNLLIDICNDDEKQELLNKSDSSGSTALYLAAQNGHSEIVILLLENTDDKLQLLKKSDKTTGFTALHVAVQNKEKNTVKAMCLKISDEDKYEFLNLKTNDGQTALSIAAVTGYTEIARILLDNAGDSKDWLIDTKISGTDYTALCLAIQNGQIEMTLLLLNSSSNKKKLFTSRFDNTRSIFSLAMLSGNHNILEKLLDSFDETLSFFDGDKDNYEAILLPMHTLFTTFEFKDLQLLPENFSFDKSYEDLFNHYIQSRTKIAQLFLSRLIRASKFKGQEEHRLYYSVSGRPIYIDCIKILAQRSLEELNDNLIVDLLPWFTIDEISEIFTEDFYKFLFTESKNTKAIIQFLRNEKTKQSLLKYIKDNFGKIYGNKEKAMSESESDVGSQVIYYDINSCNEIKALLLLTIRLFGIEVPRIEVKKEIRRAEFKCIFSEFSDDIHELIKSRGIEPENIKLEFNNFFIRHHKEVTTSILPFQQPLNMNGEVTSMHVSECTVIDAEHTLLAGIEDLDVFLREVTALSKYTTIEMKLDEEAKNIEQNFSIPDESETDSTEYGEYDLFGEQSNSSGLEQVVSQVRPDILPCLQGINLDTKFTWNSFKLFLALETIKIGINKKYRDQTHVQLMEYSLAAWLYWMRKYMFEEHDRTKETIKWNDSYAKVQVALYGKNAKTEDKDEIIWQILQPLKKITFQGRNITDYVSHNATMDAISQIKDSLLGYKYLNYRRSFDQKISTVRIQPRKRKIKSCVDAIDEFELINHPEFKIFYINNIPYVECCTVVVCPAQSDSYKDVRQYEEGVIELQNNGQFCLFIGDPYRSIKWAEKYYEEHQWKWSPVMRAKKIGAYLWMLEKKTASLPKLRQIVDIIYLKLSKIGEDNTVVGDNLYEACLYFILTNCSEEIQHEKFPRYGDYVTEEKAKELVRRANLIETRIFNLIGEQIEQLENLGKDLVTASGSEQPIKKIPYKDIKSKFAIILGSRHGLTTIFSRDRHSQLADEDDLLISPTEIGAKVEEDRGFKFLRGLHKGDQANYYKMVNSIVRVFSVRLDEILKLLKQCRAEHEEGEHFITSCDIKYNPGAYAFQPEKLKYLVEAIAPGTLISYVRYPKMLTIEEQRGSGLIQSLNNLCRILYNHNIDDVLPGVWIDNLSLNLEQPDKDSFIGEHRKDQLDDIGQWRSKLHANRLKEVLQAFIEEDENDLLWKSHEQRIIALAKIYNLQFNFISSDILYKHLNTLDELKSRIVTEFLSLVGNFNKIEEPYYLNDPTLNDSQIFTRFCVKLLVAIYYSKLQFDLQLRIFTRYQYWLKNARMSSRNLDGVRQAACALVTVYDKKTKNCYAFAVQESRSQPNNAPYYGSIKIPWGLIDSSDDSIEEAAIRELEEETGLCIFHLPKGIQLDGDISVIGNITVPIEHETSGRETHIVQIPLAADDASLFLNSFSPYASLNNPCTQEFCGGQFFLLSQDNLRTERLNTNDESLLTRIICEREIDKSRIIAKLTRSEGKSGTTVRAVLQNYHYKDVATGIHKRSYHEIFRFIKEILFSQNEGDHERGYMQLNRDFLVKAIKAHTESRVKKRNISTVELGIEHKIDDGNPYGLFAGNIYPIQYYISCRIWQHTMNVQKLEVNLWQKYHKTENTRRNERLRETDPYYLALVPTGL